MANTEGGPVEDPIAARLGELAWVLGAARPVYRAAAVAFGGLTAVAAGLAVVIFLVQQWTWPGDGDGTALAGVVLVVVLLVPALALLRLHRLTRGGGDVDAADIEADLLALRAQGTSEFDELGAAAAARPGERRWRRVFRVGRQWRRAQDGLLDADVPAVRALLAPFGARLVLLLWFGAGGLVLLAVLGLPAAIVSRAL